jgi:trimeric autotransporter adhesin
MKFKILPLWLATVFFTSFLHGDPSPSALTYQGRLVENGTPVNGLYNLRCRLYAEAENGAAYGQVDALTVVSNGLFTVTLDWGSNVLLNNYRWLEIGVMDFMLGTGFTTLQPRQYLGTAPYAFNAEHAAQADTAFSVTSLSVRNADLQDGAVTARKIHEGQVVKSLNGLRDDITLVGAQNVSVSTTLGQISIAVAVGDNTDAVELGTYNNTLGTNSTVSGGRLNSALAHNATISGGEMNRADADASNVGGGWGNWIDSNGAYATIGGGGGNTVGAHGCVISGGSVNRVDSFASFIGGGQGNIIGEGGFNTIGAGLGNRIEFLADACTIAAGWQNFIGTNAWASTIGGGEENRIESTVNWGNHRATISGGALNAILEIDNANVTIGGGYSNRVEGGSASSTIAGGEGNTIRDSSHYSTIAGGISNVTRFLASTVGGGHNNKATGSFSTVPGGRDNEADGYLSFAAGENARAMHLGSFVWADATGTNISSSAANEFTVRASGGVRFFSNSDSTAGVSMAPGSGSWSALCDRNSKTNVAPADSKRVLDALVKLPIATWNYKSQERGTRHIGPMAQDFHAAFQVGEDERHISTVDVTGVSLAAIQGLHELVRKQEAEIADLKKALAEIRTTLPVPDSRSR